MHHHLLVVSDDGRYRFRHALLREAVLADLLPGERVRLHASIAAYLAATPGAGTAAERAHHARESNDLPRAFGASLEAAVDACSVGAPAEQLQHLEAALALWPAVPDAAERAGRDQAALLLETAGGRAHGGRVAPGRRAAARSALDDAGAGRRPRGAGARPLHARPGDGPVRGRRRCPPGERGGDDAGAGRPAVGGAHLGRGHPRADELRARALDEADAAADEALAAADALGLDSAWSDTAVSQVRARADIDPVVVQRRLDEAFERARRSADVDVEMRVLFNLATVAFDAGRIDETLTWTRRATQPRARPGHRVVVLPGRAPTSGGHRAVHGGRVGREPRRGRPAGPGARDGGARARRRPAGAGRTW